MLRPPSRSPRRARSTALIAARVLITLSVASVGLVVALAASSADEVEGGMPGAPPQPIDMGTGGTIEGVVTDADGGPVSDVEVTVAKESTYPEPPLRTDKRGRYSAERLPPGKWRILVAGPRGTEQRLALLHESETVRVDFRPGAGSLTGTIRKEGRAVAGATVHVLLRLDGDGGYGLETRSTSDSQGRFEVRDLHPGVYDVSASEPGAAIGAEPRWRPSLNGVKGQQAARVTIAGGTRVEQDVDLPSVVLSGRALREDGTPLAGAAVEARSRWSSTVAARASGTSATDTDGGFTIPLPRAGDYMVKAEERDGATATLTVAVPETGLSGVVLRLPAQHVVHLSAVNGAGEPVAALKGLRLDTGRHIPLETCVAGPVTLRVPLEGKALIEVWAPGYARLRRWIAGGESDLVLILVQDGPDPSGSAR